MAKDKDSLKFLVAASALTVVLYFIPFAWLLVYPFRLFVTFIHEGGHALAALLTFGSVTEINLHLDGSGETYTRGGMGLLISSAGYLASTSYGASLLVLCRQGARAKGVLALTAAGVMALTALYVRGLFGLMVGIGLTVALVFVAVAATARIAHFLLSFLAVQCCLNALYDLNTLFFISAVSNRPSDALNMQRATGIPAVFWAVLWLAISFVVLTQALRSYTRQQCG
ncbi:MAG TPA: M50 family metallopeptidase [Blastocatellia bacterium]|nr:M50 family metallopeptidase [Blastocatellia bacterium]